MTLKAKRPILHGCTQYRVGDTLPANDTDLVNAWLNNGVAYWEEVEPKAPMKAAPAAAQAGRDGKSSDGDREAMVGRAPAKRGMPAQPAKRTGKKDTK